MMDTIKATGRESDFFVRWAGHQSRLVNVQQEVSSTSQVLSVVPGLVSNLSGLAILCVGGMRVMEGNMTMGMLLAFQVLMASFIDPVNSMVSYGSQLQEVRADLDRLEDVLHNPALSFPPDVFDAEGTLPRKLSGRLELKAVTFGYSRLEPPLLERFNLVIEPGHRVAVVGRHGQRQVHRGPPRHRPGRAVGGRGPAWTVAPGPVFPAASSRRVSPTSTRTSCSFRARSGRT